MVDFEQDGEPELLAVSVEPRDNSVSSPADTGYGELYIYIYRQEADGVRRLCSYGDNMYQKGTVSLVERDGRQYVSFYHWYNGGEASRIDTGFMFYIGSLVPANGGDPVWCVVEGMQIQYDKESGRPTYLWRYPTDENGHTEDAVTLWDLGYSRADEAYEAETARHTHLRDLVLYDGQNMTVCAP